MQKSNLTAALSVRLFFLLKDISKRKRTHLEKNKTFFEKGLDKRKQMRYNIKVRKNRTRAFSSAG